MNLRPQDVLLVQQRSLRLAVQLDRLVSGKALLDALALGCAGALYFIPEKSGILAGSASLDPELNPQVVQIFLIGVFASLGAFAVDAFWIATLRTAMNRLRRFRFEYQYLGLDNNYPFDQGALTDPARQPVQQNENEPIWVKGDDTRAGYRELQRRIIFVFRAYRTKTLLYGMLSLGAGLLSLVFIASHITIIGVSTTPQSNGGKFLFGWLLGGLLSLCAREWKKNLDAWRGALAINDEINRREYARNPAESPPPLMLLYDFLTYRKVVESAPHVGYLVSRSVRNLDRPLDPS